LSELESGEEAHPSRECDCSRRHKGFYFTKKSTRLGLWHIRSDPSPLGLPLGPQDGAALKVKRAEW